MITKRYSRANNKYLLETYDPSKPTKYIMDLDKNNLYGYAMSRPLPVGGLRFATEEEISKVDVSNLPKGFLNVDLEYPKELHDLHNYLFWKMFISTKILKFYIWKIPPVYLKILHFPHLRILQNFLVIG